MVLQWQLLKLLVWLHLVLQLNPSYTPAQIKTSLLSTAGNPIYTTGLTNDYSNTRSLLGSSQKVLYANYTLATTTTTTSTTTAAPTTTTTSTTSTTTLAPGQTTTTSTSTTTSTTTEGIICKNYLCSSTNGGYIYWTDCTTGNNASALINGGKKKYISSRTYPQIEKGARLTILIVQ